MGNYNANSLGVCIKFDSDLPSDNDTCGAPSRRSGGTSPQLSLTLWRVWSEMTCCYYFLTAQQPLRQSFTVTVIVIAPLITALRDNYWLFMTLFAMSHTPFASPRPGSAWVVTRWGQAGPPLCLYFDAHCFCASATECVSPPKRSVRCPVNPESQSECPQNVRKKCDTFSPEVVRRLEKDHGWLDYKLRRGNCCEVRTLCFTIRMEPYTSSDVYWPRDGLPPISKILNVLFWVAPTTWTWRKWTPWHASRANVKVKSILLKRFMNGPASQSFSCDFGTIDSWFILIVSKF